MTQAAENPHPNPLPEYRARGQEPEWETLGREVTCPLCDYNLRGLVEPRCPECGFSFEWGELLNPDKVRHPYLFEHYPRRNVWSFARTMVGSLRPGKFWRVLRPTHEVYPGRMVKYWSILLALVLIGPVILVGQETWRSAQQVQKWRAQWIAGYKQSSSPEALENIKKTWGSVENFVDAQVPRVRSTAFVRMVLYGAASRFGVGYRGDQWRSILRIFALLGAYLAWPWMTLATLLIFQHSMRRAKVRAVHVMRCAIYSCDVFWLGTILALGAVIGMPLMYWLRNALIGMVGYYFSLQLYVAVIFAIWCGWRLWVAYRKYLQFPHALATVAASQLIVVLIVIVVLLNASL